MVASANGREPTLFVGTAGWSIPRSHAQGFPVAGSHLARYSTVFSTAEINTSFYRPHRRSTYERWASTVPDHFRFSVKAPKSVTHSDWHDIGQDLQAFFGEIDGLGHKLGPILIQLPPSKTFSTDQAERFLSTFRCRSDADMALEPRHASWFTPEADSLLNALRMARVAADPPPAAHADQPGGWTEFTYFRLHGSPTIYRSAYGADRLALLARRLQQVKTSAWCIFDNTASYAATGDALALKAMFA